MIGVCFFKENRIICSGLKTVKNSNITYDYEGRFFYENEDSILKKIIENHHDPEILNDIKGQFALAICDQKENKLLLIRDHFGVIPLYYFVDSKKIIFGTEIHSIVKENQLIAEVNEDVIHEFFSFRYISGANTIFKNIIEVKPGTTISFDRNGLITEKEFYQLDYTQENCGNGKATEKLFQEKFWLSLNLQTLDKDRKKIGILSSGGIDSSILVGCGKKILHPKFNTYYIGNEGYEYNKTDEVNYLSSIFNTEHKNIFVSGEIFANRLIESILINEEPLNHPSTVLRYYLNTKIQHEVDVLLSGEGADCLYCGYYIFDLLRYFYVKNPLRALTRSAAALLPLSLAPGKFRSRIQKVMNVFLHQPDTYTLLYADFNSLPPDYIATLLALKFPDNFAENYTSKFLGYTKKNILNLVLSIYQGAYLVEGLNTITKIGKATGVEFRHPFIDPDLVGIFNQFSWDDKIKFFKRKYQITELGKKYLPKEFFNKRKEGFGVPLKKWFYDEQGMGRFIELLNDKKTRERGIFKVAELDRLKTLYGKKSMADECFETILWPIINLELWFRIFVDRDIKGYS